MDGILVSEMSGMNRTVGGADPFSQYRNKPFQQKTKGRKLWSAWTWTRSLESTLHLDDVQDPSKSSMQFPEYTIPSQFNITYNVDDPWKCSGCRPVIGNRCNVQINDLKVQEHISRLQDYSDCCERATGRASSSADQPTDDWVHRFRSREARGLSGGSDRVESPSVGSFLLRSGGGGGGSTSRPALAASVSMLRRRRHSCSGPLTVHSALSRPADDSVSPGGACGSAAAGGGGGGGGRGESTVYRKQVASALAAGRTVWM